MKTSQLIVSSFATLMIVTASSTFADNFNPYSGAIKAGEHSTRSDASKGSAASTVRSPQVRASGAGLPPAHLDLLG